MVSPGSPAETRAYIVERLVGDIGEPDHVIDAARAMGQRALAGIAEGLAASLAVTPGVELAKVELARFAEARPTGPEAMTTVASTSSPDALLLIADPRAIAIVLSAMFGGDAGQPVTPIERELSPLEIEVATMVFEEVAKAVNGSGPRSLDIRFPVPVAITGAELGKQAVRDGPAVRIVFSIGPAGNAGTVTLMMPQRVLLKHRGGTGAGQGAPAAPAAEWTARFNEEVMRSAVTLEATMPLARMTLGELAALQTGQVIELSPTAQSEARISARGKTLFTCEFGKLGQNYTVRIRQPFDAGQDLMDDIVSR